MISIFPKGATCGVYAICIDDHIAYIGQSTNLYARAAQHYHNILSSDKLWYPLAREFHERGHYISMKILAKPPQRELLKTEKEYIIRLKPMFNSDYRGDEAYKPIEYGEAVNRLFLGYRPPAKTVSKYKRPDPKEEVWFGEKITIRRW